MMLKEQLESWKLYKSGAYSHKRMASGNDYESAIRSNTKKTNILMLKK
jgi:hypothetical protein